jgi:hypothetical protein
MNKPDQKSTVLRQRSPNYPSYSLKECVEFVIRLYKEVDFKEVYFDDAVKFMGHSPTSSTAPRVMATVGSFGLIESRGTGNDKFIKLSRLAQEMMLGLSDEDESYERIPVQLLQEAALNDDMVNTMWNKWGSNIPQQKTVERSLLLEFNFSKPGAQRFSAVLLETYKYAKLDELNVQLENQLKEVPELPKNQPVEQINDKINNQTSIQETLGSKMLGSGQYQMQDYALPLQGGEKTVVLRAPAGLTEEDFETIITWIKIIKLGLVARKVDE